MTEPTTRGWCVANNSAQEIKPNPAPWENTVPLPAFATKDLYREWSKHPTTDYLIFSMVEGVTPSLRVSNQNSAYRIHGIVADYDCPGMSEAEVQKAVSRVLPMYPVFAWNRTFSGGLRMVWRFREPVFYYSDEVYKKFIAKAVKEMKLKAIAPNLDEHIQTAEIYYVAGNNWTINPKAIIPAPLVELWMMEATKSGKFDRDGPEIPLDVVKAEVEKQFPGRWKGDFVDGARGCRFWVAGADANAAIVRKTGMVAFTGDEPFLPWEKILGRDFVQSYRASRLGGALSEMYSDGECYYRRLENGTWDACPAANARRHLKVHYGLSENPQKGEQNSEIELVLHQLETRKRIVGALPFPLNPNPVVVWNGQQFLNESNVRMAPMVSEPQVWGENFPWIANYLTTLFLDEKNLQVFLAWLHFWVASVSAGKPRRGQSLFIAGPPGTGKTLLSRQILARIFGGYSDARENLVDGDRFNNALFEKSVWCIDDSTVQTDRKAHARFSSLVKALVANDSFPYEKKYGYKGAVPFAGRLVVTLNDDPVSLGILPDTDQSLLDKVILLRTDNCEADVHEDENERYAIIDRELPFFIRWVNDATTPEWIEKDHRFGIKAWHDLDIVREARAASDSHTILDIINLWRQETFPDDAVSQKRGYFEMPVAKVIEQLAENYKASLGRVNAVSLGRHVASAIRSGCDWIQVRNTNSGRVYRFLKP